MSDVITLPKPFSRTSARPIDRESLFATYTQLTAYAASPIAYPGQIVSVSATNTAYIIKSDYTVQPFSSESFVGGNFLPLSGGFVTGNIISNSSISANQINVDNIRLDGNTVSSTNTGGNITLQPNSGTTLVQGSLSASNSITSDSITARDVTATNLLSAASTFTRVLSVGSVQIRTLDPFNVFLGDSTTGRDAATGSHNFVFGSRAGNYLNNGSHNTFIGTRAGYSNSMGQSNIFIGEEAGLSNQNASCNNFFGRFAGRFNTTGTYNNFFNHRAGENNTLGFNNNFMGASTGRFNTTGNNNNFFGNYAGRNNTTGYNNNFFGRRAGISNYTGNYNNFFGHEAGQSNNSGSNNTIIGNRADVATGGLSGVIVLGTGAVATESDQIVLSTANVSFRNIGSTFEIGTPSLTDNLTVYGAVSSTGVVSTNTGFRVNNTALSGNFLRGNGTNFVSSAIQVSDVPTLNQNTTGSAATLSSTRTLWGQNFNGSQNVSGNLSDVNNITLGTQANKATVTYTTNTARTYTIPDAGANASFVMTEGSQTINGTKTFGSAIAGSVTGSAATLTTARTIAISGDLTYTSPAFNGSANVTAAGTLATVNSNVGSFTNASVTVNAKGLVTAASSGTAPVTTVTGISPVSSSGGTTPAISLASGYGDTQNPYASKTQNTFLAAPSAANGVPTFRTIVATDVPTLNQNTTGSAATLSSTRTLWGQNFNGSQSVTGSLTGVGNITGTGAITIQTGSTNQDISLTTTGTGEVNIAKVDIDSGTIDGTTIGLTVPASGVFTGVTVAGNVSINGNLFVSGSATQVNTTDLVVRDPIIFLAEGNLNDTVDIGFTAAYNHSLTPPRHTGLVRDNISKKWTLFSNLSTEILSAVQIPFDNPSLAVDTLVANVEGTLTGNVSGTALRANQFTTGRIISVTGDISYSSGSFDGSTNVTGTATIVNNAVTTAKILSSNVTYAKIQNVSATDRILGRSSAGAGVIEEIVCTSSGRALLSATSVSAQRDTLGVGSSQSVTLGDVIVNNGARSVLRDVYNQSVTGTNVLSLPTFAKADYNSAKFTVQIKQGTTRRCVLEILATNDNGTWEGTVYGIVDLANIFVNVNTVTTGSTVDLSFTLNGNANYTVTTSVEAISD